MFKFFKKDKKEKSIQGWEYNLLKAIAARLPSKYSFLKEQVTDDFILDSLPNEFLGEGWKRILYNQNLYDLFKKKNINYKLIGIKVFDLKDECNKRVELDIYEGIIIGYRIDENSGEMSLDKIDVSGIKQESFENVDKNIALKLLGLTGDYDFPELDIENSFKIAVPEGEFYVIKDFEDGNYLSVGLNGSVYFMVHDPYEVKKIFDKSSDFLEALKGRRFNISDFYENLMK